MNDQIVALQSAYRDTVHSCPMAARQLDHAISEAIGSVLLMDEDNTNEGYDNVRDQAVNVVALDNVARAESAYLVLLQMLSATEGDELEGAHDAISIARTNYALACVRRMLPNYVPDSDDWALVEAELEAIEAQYEPNVWQHMPAAE